MGRVLRGSPKGKALKRCASRAHHSVSSSVTTPGTPGGSSGLGGGVGGSRPSQPRFPHEGQHRAEAGRGRTPGPDLALRTRGWGSCQRKAHDPFPAVRSVKGPLSCSSPTSFTPRRREGLFLSYGFWCGRASASGGLGARLARGLWPGGGSETAAALGGGWGRRVPRVLRSTGLRRSPASVSTRSWDTPHPSDGLALSAGPNPCVKGP